MDFIRFFEKRIDKYKAVCYTGTCIFTGKGGNPMGIFSKLFGSYSTRELARIEPIKQKVLALDEEYTALSDAELKGKTQEFRDRLESGETLDSMMADWQLSGKQRIVYWARNRFQYRLLVQSFCIRDELQK